MLDYLILLSRFLIFYWIGLVQFFTIFKFFTIIKLDKTTCIHITSEYQMSFSKYHCFSTRDVVELYDFYIEVEKPFFKENKKVRTEK